VAGLGFGWGIAGFGGSMPIVFGTWVGRCAELRFNCSGWIMVFAQGIDKMGDTAISAIRFMNGSFCFFFQKEALGLFQILLG
jgi:hypothetical protein